MAHGARLPFLIDFNQFELRSLCDQRDLLLFTINATAQAQAQEEEVNSK